MELPPLHMPAAKRCKTCHALKDFAEFGSDKYRPDGKNTHCLECKRQDSLSFYGKNSEKILLRERIERIEHPEEAHARDRAKDARRLEKKAVYNVEYYALNREAELARGAERRKTHHQETLDYWASYYPEHREERLAYNAQYSREHPEVHRLHNGRRRALIRGSAFSDLTTAQWEEIQAEQKHRCYYCGEYCKGEMTKDHIDPVSKGGPDTARNIVGICQRCNSIKGTGEPPIPVQLRLLTESPPRKRKLRKLRTKKTEEAAD